MKAVSLLLTFAIIANWFFHLPMLEANQLWNPKPSYLERRQLRLGNFNYRRKTKDCNLIYDNYDPGYTRQHDIALFNVTPSAHDLTQKYQVMYFPKTDPRQQQEQQTLVSSPFLFYKLHLPRREQHQNGLEILANTGAHLFPTEAPDDVMNPSTVDMTTPAIDTMTPPAIGNMMTEDLNNNNNQPTANNMNQLPQQRFQQDATPQLNSNQNLLKNYRLYRPSNYQFTNRVQNSPHDYFNHNFAQLSIIRNYPQSSNSRVFDQLVPIYGNIKSNVPNSNSPKQTTKVLGNGYLPIKPLHMPEDRNLQMEFLQAPFNPSPFMGFTPEENISNSPTVSKSNNNDSPQTEKITAPADFVMVQQYPFFFEHHN